MATTNKDQLPITTSPLALVLDSNIWLDILVFDDPHTRPIRTALTDGKAIAWINTCCYAELTCVLDYPQFRDKSCDKNHALLWVRTYSRFFQEESLLNTKSTLPICKDHDDQKFIELAYHCQAQFLISKDKALLKLARRMRSQLNIQVLPPEVFCLHYL